MIKSLENKSIVDKLANEGWYLPFNSVICKVNINLSYTAHLALLRNVGKIVGLSYSN